MLNRTAMILIVVASVAAATFWAWNTWTHVDARVDRATETEAHLESLSPQSGARSAQAPESSLVRVFLSEEPTPDGARARLRARIEGMQGTFDFPVGWQGRAAESEVRIAAYDATLASLRAALQGRMTAAATTRGSILLPVGGAILGEAERNDLRGVFAAVGVKDVGFETQATR